METAVESPLVAADAPTNHNPTVFTPATASEMGKRSAAKRAIQREQARIQAEQRKSNPEQAVVLAVSNDDAYRLERLTRTRKQLEQLDEQLEGESDPKAVKAIADAIARLSEVERILAGRPLPGSHRPSSPKRSKDAPQSYEPVE